MQSMRHTSKPSIRPLLVTLLLVFLAVLMLMPQAKALAATDGTPLGINVKNSLITTLTFDNNDGTDSTVSVDVHYYQVLKSVTPPSRDGYTFQGYYDKITGGTQYYDADGVAIHLWDKRVDTILYARWSFQINCTIPTSADIEVDASGKSTTSTNPEFVSSSSADLRVTAKPSIRVQMRLRSLPTTLSPMVLVFSLRPSQMARRCGCLWWPQRLPLFPIMVGPFPLEA